ncbi:hypothetical protein C8F01DRAFT_387406 [Mycena amicta]|nr:hypothetical protein C8F01DRAFT_387406 [Mycena amicta]
MSNDQPRPLLPLLIKSTHFEDGPNPNKSPHNRPPCLSFFLSSSPPTPPMDSPYTVYPDTYTSPASTSPSWPTTAPAASASYMSSYEDEAYDNIYASGYQQEMTAYGGFHAPYASENYDYEYEFTRPTSSSSASCSSASSDSPLTPAYHVPPLPGLLYTKLDSPIGHRWDEGDTVHSYDASSYNPATILDRASSSSYDSPHRDSLPPIACLSPAETQLVSPVYTPAVAAAPLSIEIKQPQPKPIIPLISLAALASESESQRFSTRVSPVSWRPALSCTVPAPAPIATALLSPLDFHFQPQMQMQSSPSSASYRGPSAAADVFPSRMTFAPPTYSVPAAHPCPCGACMATGSTRSYSNVPLP